METFKVDILNPKARKLLKDLENLNLIAIRPEEKDLKAVLKKFRSKSKSVPSDDEIVREVKMVRASRYKK